MRETNNAIGTDTNTKNVDIGTDPILRQSNHLEAAIVDTRRRIRRERNKEDDQGQGADLAVIGVG